MILLLLSRLDVTRDNVASDKSEGELEQTEADEKMMLQMETSRCEMAAQ